MPRRTEIESRATILKLTTSFLYSSADQRVDASAIAPIATMSGRPHVYIAGPEAMVTNLKVLCMQSRIVESRIQATSFSGYAGDGGFD